MALLHTPQKDENLYAPDFTLKNVDGSLLCLRDVRGENGTVIAFICNHCPYVKAIIKRFAKTARKLQDQGIAVVAIMPNDTHNYPEDSFENMQKFAAAHDFSFPYLIDETQDTARRYGAICTPDIFGFTANDRLVYRGRLDSAGPNEADANTIPELLNAMTELVQTGTCTGEQHSSMGCSIKWR